VQRAAEQFGALTEAGQAMLGAGQGEGGASRWGVDDGHVQPGDVVADLDQGVGAGACLRMLVSASWMVR